MWYLQFQRVCSQFERSTGKRLLPDAGAALPGRKNCLLIGRGTRTDGIRQRTVFADGCGRVGDVEPITVPELAALAQCKLAALCNAPDTGAAVQVKFADTGKPVRRLAVISGAGGSLFAEAIAEGADCLLTGEANHHHALDAKRLGLSLIAAGHYATEFPVTAAVAAALRTALPEVEVLVSTENRDPYTYL